MDPIQQTPVSTPLTPQPSPAPVSFVSPEVSSSSSSVLLACLAYLGLLIIIPWAVAKNDPFVKFHLRQGFVLLICYVASYLLSFFLFSFIPFLSFLSALLGPILFVIMIIGIINAASGKEKALPIIGRFAGSTSL